MKIKATPINRYETFFGEDEYYNDYNMVNEYLETDVNMSIWLYAVDKEQSDVDSVYGEVKKENIILKDPIEIKCLVEILNSENKTYNKDNTLIYEEIGNLNFYVYNEVLKQHNIVLYRGDYVGYQIDSEKMLFFEIVNNNSKNFASNQTWGNFKPLFKKVECVPVDMSQFEII